MKGEIIMMGEDYGIKWSDLHSFTHGTHYTDTELKDNDLKGYKLGDYVDVEIITAHYEEDFHPYFLAVIMKEEKKLTRYTREEYNQKFLREIEKGGITTELKWLFTYLCIDVLNQKRFAAYNGKTRSIMQMRAYATLLLHWEKFNPEKGEPYPYFVTVIRSSVAGTWCEYNKRK